MWKYVLKRILIFIPTLVVITLISFFILQSAPGDPVDRILGGGEEQGGQSADRQASMEDYLEKRKELGLDLPLFYFSLATAAEPDTLHRIPKPVDRDALRRMIFEFGNWQKIEAYHQRVLALEKTIFDAEQDSVTAETVIELRARVVALHRSATPEQIEPDLQFFHSTLAKFPERFSEVRAALEQLDEAYAEMRDNPTTWKLYVPSIHFHGFNNQYHNWLMGIVRLDFGTSYMDRRPVADKIFEAVKWTLVISIISVLLTYLISIPIGIYSARNRGSLGDSLSTTTLFILYSLPNFWVAILLIMFLGGGDYLDLFPSSGVQDQMHSEDWSFFRKVGDWAYHLVLPIFCYTYASFAFLSRQMRVGVLEVLTQDYIRTARAKGLPEPKVIWKHAFRNSLIPIITIFASIFPRLVGGAVIIETIFTIPGMGRLSFQAIMQQDYPVVIAVFTIAAILTLVGVLVADVMYALVDPRISYSRK